MPRGWDGKTITTEKFVRRFAGGIVAELTAEFKKGKLQPALRCEWNPKIPECDSLLRIKDEYQAWMLEVYSSLATKTGLKLMYADVNEGGNAWICFADGTTKKVMENGKRLE